MVLLVLLTGCSFITPGATRSAGSLPSPESVAGCYRMALGDWTNTGAGYGLTPPLEFRLDTALAPGGQMPGTPRRTIGTPMPGQESRFTSWSIGAGDTLRVWWSTGYVGGGYSLAVHGDSVFGHATTRTDVRRSGTADPTAPARGARVPCA
jgi:hypothetical protein